MGGLEGGVGYENQRESLWRLLHFGSFTAASLQAVVWASYQSSSPGAERLLLAIIVRERGEEKMRRRGGKNGKKCNCCSLNLNMNVSLPRKEPDSGLFNKRD